MSTVRRFIDIGVNLTDSMYKGVYHGSKKHEADLKDVVERAWNMGMQKMIITGGSLKDSKEALHISHTHESLYSTVGCHPTRCSEFEESELYLESLQDLVKTEQNKVVAVGECGLDYDRLEFCPKQVQLRYFEKQLQICESSRLPLFLHCRNSASDLVDILSRNRDMLHGGVVHSFDGTEQDAKSILDLGYYIGVNGCSLKTADNLKVMSKIPSDRLMLETDCPWCEVRPTHAGYKYIKTTFPSVKKEKWKVGSMVKGRNEPANIINNLSAESYNETHIVRNTTWLLLVMKIGFIKHTNKWKKSADMQCGVKVHSESIIIQIILNYVYLSDMFYAVVGDYLLYLVNKLSTEIKEMRISTLLGYICRM